MLFEASSRGGGIVETVVDRGFVIELGPDSWVTEKPAARELVRDLGLERELLASNDETRKTHLLLNGRLEAMPDGLRLMVPIGRAALANVDASPLFSPEARVALRKELSRATELQRESPIDDESIASFTERHFGSEVLERIAAPLLAGVFGGDVHTLSVRAVMAPFVAMERQHGSLIAALEEREAERVSAGRAPQSIFTSLRSGLGTLTSVLASQLPPGCLRLETEVTGVRRAPAISGPGWLTTTRSCGEEQEQFFNEVVLATPANSIAGFLKGIDPPASELLAPDASSAILVAFGWVKASFELPAGFGFLVPPASAGAPPASTLLAATFVDQKFPYRAPPGGRLLRAFFGGAQAAELLRADASDRNIEDLALAELRQILGGLPDPSILHVRRWPHSLPQYSVGHLERVAALERRLSGIPGLHLLGNALHGVGIPDLIRQARTLARKLQPS